LIKFFLYTWMFASVQTIDFPSRNSFLPSKVYKGVLKSRCSSVGFMLEFQLNTTEECDDNSIVRTLQHAVQHNFSWNCSLQTVHAKLNSHSNMEYSVENINVSQFTNCSTAKTVIFKGQSMIKYESELATVCAMFNLSIIDCSCKNFHFPVRLMSSPFNRTMMSFLSDS